MPLSVRPISGLGNNLYQIATVIGLAQSEGTDWSVITPKEDGKVQEIRNWGGHYTSLCNNLPTTLQQLFPKVKWTSYAKPEDISIKSYLFDYSIFWDSLEEIRQILTPPKEVDEYIDTTFGDINFELGIHLRYVGGSDSFLPEPVNEEWIINILQKEQPKSVIIVSNRPSTARKSIDKWRVMFPNTSFRTIESQPVFIDFFCLARCCKIICSNSTLSFWAALLGVPKEKIYMSPEYKPAMEKNAIPPSFNTNRDVFYQHWKVDGRFAVTNK